jgi:nucleoside-diphosphate-sugar epimerase
VDDLIEGFIRLFERGSADPVNIGNPGEFTVRELAEIVIRKTGSTSRIVNEPLPVDDPQQRQPDITKARTELGWEPKVSLDEGLDRTIPWFRSLLAAT